MTEGSSGHTVALPRDLPRTLAALVDHVIRARGWTLDTAARECGMSIGGVAAIRNGARSTRRPRPSTLVRLSRGLGVPQEVVASYAGIAVERVRSSDEEASELLARISRLSVVDRRRVEDLVDHLLRGRTAHGGGQPPT